MTYEERQKWVCEQCGKPETCGYVGRNLVNKCCYNQDVMEGWELGQKDAVEKACNLLVDAGKYMKYNAIEDCYSFNAMQLVEEFKEYMEESV